MTETITKDLRDRIEEAEARNAERMADLVPVETSPATDESVSQTDNVAAKAETTLADIKGKVVGFAKDNPGLAIAGGIVAGLAIASLFQGPRKLAARGSAKAAGLASRGGEVAIAYALDAYYRAQEAGADSARQLEDLGDAVGDTARKAKRRMDFEAGTAKDKARARARDARKAISRRFSRV